ncbi:MAG: ribonuclease HI [Sulfurovum sp.]|nr:ribonuclease HI [Sulfurovum sp.]
MKKQITLYSDGSSLGNPGPGGYGGILEYRGKRKEYSGAEPYTTNNRMELRAVIEGLKLLKDPCMVEVVSDSSYVVKAINEWLPNWIRKEFKKVKNPDLWKEYLEVASPHDIKGKWVRGHNGHPENERCDTLAREEAEKIKGSSNTK